MRKGYTLVELVVAVAILAIIASFAGAIFKVGIESHRMAGANAEIMQKLRAITDQLNADFKGLRKDGEIYVVWSASPDDDLKRYVRFDRMMFFANGDFHSYAPQRPEPTEPPRKYVRGNVARISYMLARNADDKAAEQFTQDAGPELREKERRARVLARTQHILTADAEMGLFPFKMEPFPYLDPLVPPEDVRWWHNTYEFDKTTLQGWKSIPWIPLGKANLLTCITDVTADPRANQYRIGAVADPRDPNTIHKLLCEGVGEFMIQGWYEYDPNRPPRWVPETDWDGDGYLTNGGTDFILDAGGEPDPDMPIRVLYPLRGQYPYGLIIGDITNGSGDPLSAANSALYQDLLTKVNEEHFNEIPGLGRALKFTFTLYDSRGIIEGGRRFTHIVYLDD